MWSFFHYFPASCLKGHCDILKNILSFTVCNFKWNYEIIIIPSGKRKMSLRQLTSRVIRDSPHLDLKFWVYNVTSAWSKTLPTQGFTCLHSPASPDSKTLPELDFHFIKRYTEHSAWGSHKPPGDFKTSGDHPRESVRTSASGEVIDRKKVRHKETQKRRGFFLKTTERKEGLGWVS